MNPNRFNVVAIITGFLVIILLMLSVSYLQSHPISIKLPSFKPPSIEVDNPPNVSIPKPVVSMQRSTCFGFCPVYSVDIYDEGSVIFQGTINVKVTGEQRLKIDPQEVQTLISQAERIGYFSFKDSYTGFDATDMSTVTTKVVSQGKTKSIVHYLGDFSAPGTLTDFEDYIDQVARTERWVYGQTTLESYN